MTSPAATEEYKNGKKEDVASSNKVIEVESECLDADDTQPDIVVATADHVTMIKRFNQDAEDNGGLDGRNLRQPNTYRLPLTKRNSAPNVNERDNIHDSIREAGLIGDDQQTQEAYGLQTVSAKIMREDDDSFNER